MEKELELFLFPQTNISIQFKRKNLKVLEMEKKKYYLLMNNDLKPQSFTVDEIVFLFNFSGFYSDAPVY